MTRAQQQVGKHGQELAAAHLRSLGFEMVEEIGTPVKLIPAHASRRDVFRVVFGDKVSGDHRALLPDGSSVLVETKTVFDGNLTWGHLRDHQPERLTQHARIGNALSLLVWVRHTGIYVMRWGVDGIDGFGFRKSITPDRAYELHALTMLYIGERMNTEVRK